MAESEVYEYFNAIRERGREKRKMNTATSPMYLKAHDVYFETKTPSHLHVFGEGCRVDFWPGTGLWIDTKNQRRGRGVKGLVKYIKSSMKESNVNNNTKT